MDSRRVVLPSGVMMASTAKKMKIMHILMLKLARWFAGGDGFCSECTRCSLRVYYTERALPFFLEGVSGYAMFPVPS
jgi:hypothetical protein